MGLFLSLTFILSFQATSGTRSDWAMTNSSTTKSWWPFTIVARKRRWKAFRFTLMSNQCANLAGKVSGYYTLLPQLLPLLHSWLLPFKLAYSANCFTSSVLYVQHCFYFVIVMLMFNAILFRCLWLKKICGCVKEIYFLIIMRQLTNYLCNDSFL